MPLQNLRSSTASKRPDASSMSDGQIALNTAAASAGLFFKDSNGDLVKTGPVHIGTTAPNSTPATGGSTGNSKGEAWLDTSNNNYVLKIYDGTAFRSVEIAPGSARQLLQTNAAGTDVEFTSNVDVPGTLDVTGVATFDNNVTISGDLTVNGTTTTIDSTTLVVEDKNIEMGAVTTPSDTTADGGGITLKGATDKTINWLNSTNAWTLSEHVNIASAKEYRINGTKVLDATSLGSAVVSSSLTSVGTIGTGVWNGTPIATAYIADSSVTSAKIVDGTIVDADISATAEISVSKLANGTARQLLQTDAAGTGVEFTSNVDVPGTLDVSSTAVFDASVGIGTLSPIAQLTAREDNSGGQGGTMCIQNTGSGLNTNVALFLTPNNGGGNDLQRSASIKSRQDTAGNFANLEFYTSASDTPTERVRITSTGTIRIGQTTSDDPSGSDVRGVAIGNDYISCNGQNGNSAVFGRRGSDGSCVLFRRQTTNVGSISVNGSSTAYNTSSDHRLKENVVDISDGITRVKQLAPKRFNFIADADTTVDGFLAHEAQAVVPEAVHGTHNEIDDEGNPVMQGIDQSKLVPLLTAALQEAIAKIETLEIKVAALEAQ